ncbi:MAG TPA: MFS transporter [Candidatus Thermoplasmatota archaeon]|nr:MFS transporter [Candidatus Thermoplasmatota archaeon]
MADGPSPHPLPAWSWAYVTFRYADGATNALVSLAVVLHYDLPLWALAATTAAMNLAGVPAAFLWGALVDRLHDRRPVVVGGFAVAALALATLALLPPFPVYVAGAVTYTAFGVATSPAASTMVLAGLRRSHWAPATGRLSRRTGFAFLAGMGTAILVGFAPGPLPFQAVFAGAAVVAALAALVAARTVPGPPSVPASAVGGFDPGVAQAGQRRFERPVFFPARLLDFPTLRGLRTGLARGHRLWPLGVALTFTGSVAFFTSYPGVLSTHLGLAAGVVLLCQAPSHIVTPITYPWAGRHGARVGESRGVRQGALLRLVGVPGLCAAIFFLGASAVPLLLALHALMGFSFALIQTNGPLILAELHPGGRGQGVGLYHAAVGTGTLAGSASAFALLRLFPYPVSYLFAVGLTVAGVALLASAHERLQRERHAPLPI